MCFFWILKDVSEYCFEIILSFYRFALKSSLKKMPAAVIFSVKIHGIAGSEFLNKLTQVGICLSYKKMDMIIHKTVSIQFNICLFRVLLNAVNDEKTVSIIKEDALPVITAQNNMINLGFTFFSGFSTHLFFILYIIWY